MRVHFNTKSLRFAPGPFCIALHTLSVTCDRLHSPNAAITHFPPVFLVLLLSLSPPSISILIRRHVHLAPSESTVDEDAMRKLLAPVGNDAIFSLTIDQLRQWCLGVMSVMSVMGVMWAFMPAKIVPVSNTCHSRLSLVLFGGLVSCLAVSLFNQLLFFMYFSFTLFHSLSLALSPSPISFHSISLAL